MKRRNRCLNSLRGIEHSDYHDSDSDKYDWSNADDSNIFWKYLVQKNNLIESDKVIFTMITLEDGKMIYEWFSRDTPSSALYQFIKIFLTNQELKQAFDKNDQPNFTLKTKINNEAKYYSYTNEHKLGSLFKSPSSNGRFYANFKMEMLNPTEDSQNKAF